MRRLGPVRERTGGDLTSVPVVCVPASSYTNSCSSSTHVYKSLMLK